MKCTDGRDQRFAEGVSFSLLKVVAELTQLTYCIHFGHPHPCGHNEMHKGLVRDRGISISYIAD